MTYHHARQRRPWRDRLREWTPLALSALVAAAGVALLLLSRGT
jgi:hypothetical protein